MIRSLHDFEVTRVAAQAVCKRETVRAYLKQPERMKPATRARVQAALRALGYEAEQSVAPATNVAEDR
jgi:DNA-binding LacI/PurR family transcriptional regulator